MNDHFYGPFFRFICGLLRFFQRKYAVEMPQNINGPLVYISHHQHFFGPIEILLWFPTSLHAWILHILMEQKACYHEYVETIFTKRYEWNRTLAKICALPLSYFISKLLISGKGIPVYRGSRKILQTFKLSVEALINGKSIIIFPDIDYRDASSSTKEMYDGFLYIEKYYYKASGQHVCFIPLYASKKKRLIRADRPIYFRDEQDFDAERKRVCQLIQDRLNDIAKTCGDV